MSTDRFTRSVRRFVAGERGSVTVEFVLWAPLIFYVGVAMFVLSYYVATASEVQQVAHEVARSTFGLVNVAAVEGDLCEEMNDQVLPQVVSRMALVRLDHFAPIAACPSLPDVNGYVTVTVTYDLTNSALHSLGRLIGFDFGSLSRASTVQL